MKRNYQKLVKYKDGDREVRNQPPWYKTGRVRAVAEARARAEACRGGARAGSREAELRAALCPKAVCRFTMWQRRQWVMGEEKRVLAQGCGLLTEWLLLPHRSAHLQHQAQPS